MAWVERSAGRDARVPRELAEEHATLQRENERLRARLEKAETIIEVQKKLCELLGVETAESKGIENE
jgi:regulator of replication initiation timing